MRIIENKKLLLRIGLGVILGIPMAYVLLGLIWGVGVVDSLINSLGAIAGWLIMSILLVIGSSVPKKDR